MRFIFSITLLLAIIALAWSYPQPKPAEGEQLADDGETRQFGRPGFAGGYPGHGHRPGYRPPPPRYPAYGGRPGGFPGYGGRPGYPGFGK